jgi:hypothetical protein
MDGEQRQQSEFNMAISYLTRLNILLTNCDDASMNLDSHFWFHSLLGLYRELSTEMNQKEMTELDNKIKFLLPYINEQQRYNSKAGKDYINESLYMQLHNLEIRLRNIIKSSGLQMKMKDDASRSLR